MESGAEFLYSMKLDSMPLPNWIRKIIACWRDFGADETFFRILQQLRILSQYRSLDIYWDERGKPPSRLPEAQNGFLNREISRREISGLALDPQLPPPEEFEKQFDRGSRLFGAFKENRLVGVNWANTRFADLTHIGRPFISLPPETVYTYGIFVSPSHRGKRAGVFLKEMLMRTLGLEGFRYYVLAVYLRDVRVSKWHRSNGFRKWGRIFYFRLFGKYFRCARPTAAGKRALNLFPGNRDA